MRVCHCMDSLFERSLEWKEGQMKEEGDENWIAIHKVIHCLFSDLGFQQKHWFWRFQMGRFKYLNYR